MVPRKVVAGVLVACGAVAATAWLASGKAAAPTPAPAIARAYARLAAAPPAPSALVGSAPLQAMAHRSGVDPDDLREVVHSEQPLGSLVTGRDRRGHTCVAEATPAVAGSFACDPFAKAPLYLVAGAHGAASSVTWSGFLAVVDGSVARVAVRLADGSTRDLAINHAGGVAYGGSSPASFPTQVVVYSLDGRRLTTLPLPSAASPEH
jgi:hypothetical protein